MTRVPPRRSEGVPWRGWREPGPWRIALGYAVLTILWIVASDPILALIVPSRAGLIEWQLAKGIFWALGSGAVILIVVQKHLRRLHRRSEEYAALGRRVEVLMQSTAAGLIATDLEGRCTLVNRAASDMLGCPPDGLIGVPVERLLPGDENGGERLVEALRSNAAERRQLYDLDLRRGDGSTLACDITLSPLVHEGNLVGRAISFVDVAQRRELERQLEHAERLTSLGRLAASIAHEMNNVLMGILPFAELVTRSGDARLQSAGEQIRRSVRRGRTITGEILKFARPSEVETQRLDAGRWLQSIARELEMIVATSGSFELRILEEPLWIDADPDQLGQVFTNLVTNARDAMITGQGRITVEAERVPAGAGSGLGALPETGRGWVWFRVRDDGSGMDVETLAHLFDPFFTRKRGGTGLGLPIAHQAVVAHGGVMFVESREGTGSTFHIYLPESGPAEARAVEGEPAGGALPRSVLLVEDDENVASGLAMALEIEGVDVRLAPTGRAALEMLRGEQPEAMILDIGLPDMDGNRVADEALARWPGLPIVFSTGHGDATQLDGYLHRPNVVFLRKPYAVEDLRAAILRAMARGA